MTQEGIRNGCLALALGFALASSPEPKAADEGAYPPWNEVFSLVQSNLVGTAQGEINRAAIDGLIAQLGPKVQLLPSAEPGESQSVLIPKTALHDGAYGYLQIGTVEKGLLSAVQEALRDLLSSNAVKGLVLDLRFANGFDYGAAASTADLFVAERRLLMKVGDEELWSERTEGDIELPLAVLMNARTEGAAEALALALREGAAALLIGSRSGGQRYHFREVRLSSGQRLRIASGPVTASAAAPASGVGIEPDLSVNVPIETEQRYLSDAFQALPTPFLEALSALSTNAISTVGGRRRVNEADLVRMQREILRPPEELSAEAGEDRLRPVVNDPVLGRALDFLKGVSVVQNRKQPNSR